VLGGEEIDWVLCEAYAGWRLPLTLAEGGAAVVLGRRGRIEISRIHEGAPFFDRSGANRAIRAVCRDLAKGGAVDLVVSGANGAFLDEAERAALQEAFPGAPCDFPKRSLGEALGAGALMQTIYGALALEKRGLKTALVSAPGLNQQAAGLILRTG
jgi:hypothetical protein